jgi:hypothetical protein
MNTVKEQRREVVILPESEATDLSSLSKKLAFYFNFDL